MTASLTRCVAATILCREVVELRLQFRWEVIVRGSERVGQLLGSARTENDGRNSRVRQDPSDCQFRQCFAFFASDLTQLADRHELALMPVAGPIRGAELSDFRRKASLFRLLVQLIFPAKEATGQRVE